MDEADQADRIASLVVQIYAIHEAVISESGGLEGLRDGLLLHAAVARPFVTFARAALYPDDFEQAAALFHSLIKSHPFMDGTKRTAFLAALYFLENRGHAIPKRLPKHQVIAFCLEVATENIRRAGGEVVQPKSIAQIAEWFRRLLSEENSER
ncbi:MAG TPA: type II toxin-antitoxin system death-on-curing family toxin [Ardenticatenaceae bacterium]|nr:type II toxin-antitoxin system death-on-curing family toxin [Ardenticatenaceae bacterium]